MCSALRATHSLLPLWEQGCTVGRPGPTRVALHPGGWRLPERQLLWIVERGVGAVVKWSCGVIERCGNMSVSQHEFKEP